MLAIVDYRAGNQTSVRRALEHLDIPCTISADPEILRQAQGVIFPGVGAAGQAMRTLKASGLDRILKELVEDKRPLLGICLGCQILLEESEEDSVKTLAVLPGTCRRFPSGMCEEDGSLAPVPHMGWNQLRHIRDCQLFAGIANDAEFYFVHSYYALPAPEYVLSKAHYGIDFCAVYGRTGLWAMQFHPEKSGAPGLRILKNFYSYCREHANAV